MADACGRSTWAVSTLGLAELGEPVPDVIGSTTFVDCGSANLSVRVACLKEPSLEKPNMIDKLQLKSQMSNVNKIVYNNRLTETETTVYRSRLCNKRRIQQSTDLVLALKTDTSLQILSLL